MMDRVFAGLIVMSVLLGAVVGSAKAQGDDLNPQTQFTLGNVAYKSGDYPKAIEAYEGILSRQIESGALYYNLGNCYVKTNHVGKAVLNYERAKRLIPRDSQLEFNLRYARGLMKEYAGESTVPFWRGLFADLNDH